MLKAYCPNENAVVAVFLDNINANGFCFLQVLLLQELNAVRSRLSRLTKLITNLVVKTKNSSNLSINNYELRRLPFLIKYFPFDD